jgi:predicted ATP-grasp superfamily ATP-dependent carboligase
LSSRRLRILFTEGASLSARQSLYPIGRLHDVDVMDPDPLCQCRFSSLVRRYTQSPSFAKQPVEFLRFVARLVRERQYDVLLPTHEQVYLLSRFRDAFAPHVGLALPDFTAMERLHNKADFSRLLSELNLPQPEVTIVRSVGELLGGSWQYPFYLKLAHSTAGGGVLAIDSPETLRRHAEELERGERLIAQSEMLVQQPGQGLLCTVQAVFNQGELVGIHTFESRRLGVGGMSTARIGADHPIVREHMERLGRYLTWHGAFFTDYFYDRQTRQPQYIENNPRIGETVNAWLSDVNLPELLVQVSAGHSPPKLPLGRTGVRTHNLFMILMSMAYDGAGRAELLREIRRNVRGEGLYDNSEDDLYRTQDDPLCRVPFTWVVGQLLACPGRARKYVTKTVENYSLPEAATERIKALPLDLLDGEFR